MNDYFIIERTKPDMKEYLSSLPADNQGHGWSPTPRNAFNFPSAVLAEVKRQELTESYPGFKYQLYQVRTSIFPIEVKTQQIASTR